MKRWFLVVLSTLLFFLFFFFFFSSRRRHTRSLCDWSSDVCSSDLYFTFTSCSGSGGIGGVSCGGSGVKVKYAGDTSAGTTPIGQLPAVNVDRILTHTKVLSSDAFEGRAPGTKGEDKTVQYIEDQFKQIGLKPGNTDGTYVQKVPLVGITPDPAPLVFARGAQKTTLKWKDDVVAWTKHVDEHAGIKDSELVFVGYGVVAPE